MLGQRRTGESGSSRTRAAPSWWQQTNGWGWNKEVRLTACLSGGGGSEGVPAQTGRGSIASVCSLPLSPTGPKVQERDTRGHPRLLWPSKAKTKGGTLSLPIGARLGEEGPYSWLKMDPGPSLVLLSGDSPDLQTEGSRV